MMAQKVVIKNQLETLLAEHDNITSYIPTKVETKKYRGQAVDMQTAAGSASLQDFIAMVGLIVEYAMDDYNVEFLSDDNDYFSTDDNNRSLNNPMIMHKVLKRVPKNEFKPIVREEVIQKDDSGVERLGTMYGMRFDCKVQFNILASEHEVANQVMERFEDLMISYAGYIKNQGVAEFYFIDQYTDSYYKTLREKLSVRSLVYYVEIEKLLVIFNEKIKDIPSLGDVKKQ